MTNYGEYFPTEENLNDKLPDYIREELEHGLRSAFGDHVVISDDMMTEIDALPAITEDE